MLHITASSEEAQLQDCKVVPAVAQIASLKGFPQESVELFLHYCVFLLCRSGRLPLQADHPPRKGRE